MFRYYSLSRICYAFLRDVPPNCDPHASVSFFTESRWHLRGWTLQELIASPFLLFISNQWTTLGDKADLARIIQLVTEVPEAVLRSEKDLADTSVAARMSWASRRETTRIEDQAYCLMGLFGVNMPTLYGEGHKAFYRLQEEIMKSSMDASLFAWGHAMIRPTGTRKFGIAASQCNHQSPVCHLLAPSPKSFMDAHRVEFNVRPWTPHEILRSNPLFHRRIGGTLKIFARPRRPLNRVFQPS